LLLYRLFLYYLTVTLLSIETRLKEYQIISMGMSNLEKPTFEPKSLKKRKRHHFLNRVDFRILIMIQCLRINRELFKFTG
jgi:hypothetical protein